jgi:DNA invertase Pin-like site-specific DNA recombinase
MRPHKNIPVDDVLGLKTLIDQGKTPQEIADYYGVHRTTIVRRLKLLHEGSVSENNGIQ